jgi:hypothetical protein
MVKTRSTGICLGLVFLVITALTGCLLGGGGGKKQNGVRTSHEGVYRLDHSTKNLEGCDAEGPSVLEGSYQDYLALLNGEFFGFDVVSLVECADTADCRQQAAEAKQEGINLFGFTFSEGNDAVGFSTEMSTAFSIDSNLCEGRVAKHTLTHPATNVIRMETRVTSPGPFPRGPDGCDPKEAIRLSRGKPCSELSVKSATRVAGF